MQLSAASFPPSFLLPALESLSLRASGATLLRQAQQIRGIRSIQKPPPKLSRYDHNTERPPRGASQQAAFLRKLPGLGPRPGLLGFKREMSSIYDPETGIRTPVTIIQLDRNQVVAHKTLQKHGYIAATIGCGARGVKNTTRPELGHYAKQGVAPKSHQVEFRTATEDGLPPVGALIKADWFNVGQFIDARAKCKGKGFAGVMKKHGFHGQDASHGVSLTHRSMGSSGQGQGGGSRVYPGKKMAGRMGGQYVTMQNLKIVRVDAMNGIVVVAGAVPGPFRGLVEMRDAYKKDWPEASNPYTMPDGLEAFAVPEVTEAVPEATVAA